MERVTGERKIARLRFTLIFKNAEELLRNEETSKVRAELQKLKIAHDKLSSVQNEFLVALEATGAPDEEISKELQSSDAYDTKFYNLAEDINSLLSRKQDIADQSIKNENTSESDSASKRHYRLPRLELPTFNGEIKHWLTFWTQFKKIHTDVNIDNEDKLQYLLQSMEDGSSAKELVRSFPPTGDNYCKVLEQLKSRFARDELLIEHYVRELLQLVIAQTKTGSKMPLRSMYDKLMTQMLALDSMGISNDKYAAFLYPLVESALSEDILRAWNRSPYHNTSSESKEYTNLTKLLLFIRNEVESEERISLSRGSFIKNDINPNIPTASFLTETVNTHTKHKIEKGTVNVQNIKEKVCIWCNKSHISSECYTAQKMSLDERKEFLKKKRACFRCLNIGHQITQCRKNLKCLICSRRHHPIMCPDIDKANGSSGKHDEKTVLKQVSTGSTVLLQTVNLKIVHNKKIAIVRALLDSGAQRSFVRSDIIEMLQIEADSHEKLQHNLFGGVVTKLEEHRGFVLNCQSMDGKYEFKIDALESKVICDDLPRVGPGEVLSKLQDQGSLYTGRSVHLSDNLVAIETKLGWTIQGPTAGNYTCSINFNVTRTSFDIDDLWNLETLGIRDEATVKKLKQREEEVELFFKETVRVNDEHRYEVKLPWKETGDILSTNYDLAYKRLVSTTCKLNKLGLLQDYNDVFNEWLQNGIIEEVPQDDKNLGHYLPHHAVIRESSSTTKIRPVFDASAMTKEGINLNKCLEKGSNLICLIPRLLIEFRRNPIGITSDIKKAFLQISIYPEDREYLKFLWWRDITTTEKKVKVFRHRRVVFGVTTSPFLLAATISHHLEQFKGDTVQKLKNSFYVDNCVTSVNSEEERKTFIDEATSIMKKGNFDLRGWVSGPTLNEGAAENITVLGINWNPVKDYLWFRAPLSCNKVEIITKRHLLSMAQSIFDPLGFLCPTTIIPKVLIQKSWQEHIDWDTELPENIAKPAKEWLKQLKYIEHLRIPRPLSKSSLNESKCTLHIFCDASQDCYATCIFLRSEYENKVDVQLVIAKARVVPIKPVTIPRLELIAALMGTRLASEAKEALQLDCKEYYWTDSSIVIAWIRRTNGLNVFVHNRVKEIANRSKIKDWHHIPGELNPADLPSRGVNAHQLAESKWWEGPNWLQHSPDKWPNSNGIPDEDEVNKEVSKNCLVVKNEIFSDRFCYFSKYTKIVKTVGWCLRFIQNCQKNLLMRNKSYLTAKEYILAEKKLFYVIQKEHFRDIDELKRKTKLELFIDKDNLLRVKTRLSLANDEANFIYPILLPSQHFVIYRLVTYEHSRVHVGTQTLISILRENLWIIGVRSLVKKVVKMCMKCKRFKAKACTVAPAPLPANRINCGSPFDVTGTDLAGPIYLKDERKRWIVLFTCATYRALHIELVDSLSAEDFILALRRLIARRGRIKVIYSDNATNFRGTKNAMDSIDWNNIADRVAVEKIEWRFLPPQAPWWGGWYERMVRTIKELLRRTLGKAALSDKELVTVLCEVESAINSRPLTYIADNTESLTTLTPAMFLHTNSSAVTDLENIDARVLTGRYKYVNKLSQDIKQRFRSEYLSLLTQSQSTSAQSVQIGDIVLVSVDGVKRTDWPLGLILEIYPGVDGMGRVARVKLAHGERIRPLQRLYPLELSVPQSSVSDTPVVGSGDPQSPPDVNYKTRAGRSVKLPSRINL